MKLFKSYLYACLLFITPMSFAEVAVIVNPANANAVSDDDINRIFLGKNKTFANGDSVEAVNLKTGEATREEFETKALGKTSSQVKAYWSKLIFSGKAKPLNELGSDSEIISFVASTPNAIAYVNAASVDASVKVVKKL